MKKICIVVCYFGKWPKWFNLYLKSCRYNPTVNWLFYTDCGKPKNAPDNVEFIKGTLEDFNNLVSKKLGFKINIKSKRQLCDLKPAYGVILEDYLKNHDFWGYGDIDLIYGNIRKFITDSILKEYDVVSAKKEYLVGHFTLFRNCDKINRLHEEGPYKKVFSDLKYHNFDESNWIFHRPAFDMESRIEQIICFFEHLKYLIFCRHKFNERLKIKSMTHIVKSLAKKDRIKIFLKTMLKTDSKKSRRYFFLKCSSFLNKEWKLNWENGKLIDTWDNKEILYFHFQLSKEDDKFLIPKWKKIPNNFFITSKGFIKKLN
jgi:hypothetical protein